MSVKLSDLIKECEAGIDGAIKTATAVIETESGLKVDLITVSPRIDIEGKVTFHTSFKLGA